LNWRPKSTPRPTNRTKKATEITFSAPTTKRPKAAEIARPTARLMATGKMIRAERNASHRMTRTEPMETTAVNGALSRLVATWSSCVGSGPVGRARAGWGGSGRRSWAVETVASGRELAGSIALYASGGATAMNRWNGRGCADFPEGTTRHEELGGCPER